MLTPESRRADFPSLEGMSYLNSAAESIPPRSVGEALQKYWEHKLLGMRGREFHQAEMEGCRESAARLLEMRSPEVSFCSCSSEAYNLLASCLDLEPGEEVVVSDLDFPAGATPWLTSPRGLATKVWRSRDGILDLADLAPLLSEKTRLVQVSQVSFLNGYRIPWEPFREAVRRLAPRAILAVDVTQALGRVELGNLGADCVISSTHKWVMGVHGSCIIGIPEASAERLTTKAGGWYHLANAFEADRFERAQVKPGAISFSVGMPSFAPIYALKAGIDYVLKTGVAAIAAQADPLTRRVSEGVRDLGLQPMCPYQKDEPSGIVAFRHERAREFHDHLLQQGVHVMHHAGRVRIAVHGYNTAEDISRLLGGLKDVV